MTTNNGAKALKLYIAGPMRGRLHFNFEAFDEVARTLTLDGHSPFSPAARDRAKGFDPILAGMTGLEDLAELGFDLRDALNADLSWITGEADAVILLDGWRESRGALAELFTAAAVGIPAYEWADARRFNSGSWPATCTDMTQETYASWGLEAEVIDEPELAGGEIRVVSSTGGAKGAKPLEVGAVDPLARAELGRVAHFGGLKYGRGNYLNGYDWSLCVDAMHRHVLAFEAGQDRDEESGLLHTVHAAWHGLALASFALRGIGTDDRFETPAELAP